MLVLTRRHEESITIGHNAEIVIKVLHLRGSQVWIGVEAPRDVPVHRTEFYNRLAAAEGKPTV